MTEADLNAYLGKNISEICPTGFHSNSDNHCAHFVSHALGLRFGITCRSMVRSDGVAASIRVQEIFPYCPRVGAWSDLPPELQTGLVFILRASNVDLTAKTIVNVPRKHVGIFCGSSRTIWHYSNSRDKVVSQTPEQFAHHYPHPDNAMFWGELPHGSGI